MTTAYAGPLRVGAFRFLNSLPVLAGFLDENGETNPAAPPVRWGGPSDCARWLACDEVNAALIPSIEFARGQDLRYIPDVAISTHRQVRSVIVLSREPLERCTSIALDASSRTSVALLQVLLARRFRTNPRLESMPPQLDTMLAKHDAALLIADTALVAPASGLHVYDLAAEWHAMTGLPFVFALWAVRGEVATGLDETQLAFFQRARELQPEDLRKLASREAPKLGLDPEEAYLYLQDNLHYRLGKDELRALEEFFRMAAEEGVAPAGATLRPVPQPAGTSIGTSR